MAAPTAHEARAILRKGRARPLWYGHPWVYANAIATIEGESAARRRRVADRPRRALHRQGLLQRALADSGAPVHARPTRRSTRPSCASGSSSARAARARLGLPSADTNAYRLVNSEGDDLPGLVIDVYADTAAVQITTLAMSMRRAEIYDALEAELGVKTIFELAPASYAELEGYAAGSRVARGASRAARARARERRRAGGRAARPGRRRACSSTSARRARGSRSLARGARVLDVYAYAGGFGLAAARAGAAAVTAVDSSARAVARITAHAAANGVAIEAIEADAFRYLETATPRAFDLVVIDPPKFARARKDLDAARKGYERLNALALQAVAAGADPGDLLLLAERRRRDLRAHRRRRRQAGRPRGPRLRTPRPRLGSPDAAGVRRGAVPEGAALLRHLSPSGGGSGGGHTAQPAVHVATRSSIGTGQMCRAPHLPPRASVW